VGPLSAGESATSELLDAASAGIGRALFLITRLATIDHPARSLGPRWRLATRRSEFFSIKPKAI
jgi:hypothetical protein